ncbi:unnamed protein product [Diabrotica balteata]|uniref:Uncharacterized protein n=1 Tax=Diabrotica balteata TaxID=107213 RepID=A0A9N9X8F6_DIABA|nr:unnamed protein product [Diabrotica balteata]
MQDFGPHLLEKVDNWHNICQRLTDVKEELIEEVKEGQFPEDDALQMGDKMHMDEKILFYHLPDMHKADAVHYLKCNAEAKKLPLDHVKKVWEMLKCVHKSVDEEDFGPRLLEKVDTWHNICQRLTDVKEELIEKMKEAQFPEDDALQMGDKMKMDEKMLRYYLPDMHKADAVHYLKCNAEAREKPVDHIRRIWEMQKCIQKTVDDKHYIFF